MIEQNLEQECLTFDSYEDAVEVQKILIQNGYCTMMSKEEHLWCLNWVWTCTPADRNEVIFIGMEKYEGDWDKFSQDHPELRWDDSKMEWSD